MQFYSLAPFNIQRVGYSAYQASQTYRTYLADSPFKSLQVIKGHLRIYRHESREGKPAAFLVYFASHLYLPVDRPSWPSWLICTGLYSSSPGGAIIPNESPS